jgi:hypothetical protein
MAYPVREARPCAFRGGQWFWRNAASGTTSPTCRPMPDHFGMTTAGLARPTIFLPAVLRLGAYDPCLRPCREQTRPVEPQGDEVLEHAPGTAQYIAEPSAAAIRISRPAPMVPPLRSRMLDAKIQLMFDYGRHHQVSFADRRCR